MRVLHLMLSCFYIDNAHYQENIIPKINKEDGHEVLIIASTEVFVKNNLLGVIEPSTYINEYGIKVIRAEYTKIFNTFLSKKVRAYKGIYGLIEDFSPDVILFHGTAAYALKDVSKYKRKHPWVKFLVDSHEDFNNSSRTFISKYILHSLFYKKILLHNLKYIDKVLYITKETYNYLRDFYNVPEDKLHFFPLGGTIPSKELRNKIRRQLREELGVLEDEILCIHSGKLDKLKRTEEILRGFLSCKREKIKLVVIGSIDESFQNILKQALKDKRVQYLGWKRADELQEYLMASDLYLQLGSQSATMQQAICNGNVVALYPHESHTFLLGDSCFYIRDESNLKELLSSVSISSIQEKRDQSFKLAQEILDYRVISNSIFEI